jgi:hypothetical protein
MTMDNAPDRSGASGHMTTARRGFFSRMRGGSRPGCIAGYESRRAAINEVQAVIALDGNILQANENVLIIRTGRNSGRRRL